MSELKPSKPFTQDVFICLTNDQIERLSRLPQLLHQPLNQQVVSCFLAGLRGFEQNVGTFAVFPRENADTKGHGSGEQEAQAPLGPRPSQETEPLGGAGESYFQTFCRVVGILAILACCAWTLFTVLALAKMALVKEILPP